MHQILGGLREVPLQVAAQSRVVIENAQHDRALPLAAVREHLERPVVEIEMPQGPDVLGFVAADLSSLASVSRARFAGAASWPPAAACAASREPSCTAARWNKNARVPAKDRPSPARPSCRSAAGRSSKGGLGYWLKRCSARAGASDTCRSPCARRVARRRPGRPSRAALCSTTARWWRPRNGRRVPLTGCVQVLAASSRMAP